MRSREEVVPSPSDHPECSCQEGGGEGHLGAVAPTLSIPRVSSHQLLALAHEYTVYMRRVADEDRDGKRHTKGESGRQPRDLREALEVEKPLDDDHGRDPGPVDPGMPLLGITSALGGPLRWRSRLPWTEGRRGSPSRSDYRGTSPPPG